MEADAIAAIAGDDIADHAGRERGVQPDAVVGRSGSDEQAIARIAGGGSGEVQADVVVVQRDVAGLQRYTVAVGVRHGHAKELGSIGAQRKCQARIAVAVDLHHGRPAAMWLGSEVASIVVLCVKAGSALLSVIVPLTVKLITSANRDSHWPR